MKRNEFFTRAEALYIDGGCTFEEIAAQLGLSDKTVRTWADEGGWREKRAKLTEKRASLDDRLYEFTNKLMTSIQGDWDAGNQVDPGRLYALTRLIDKLQKAQNFEAAKKAQVQSTEEAAKQASVEEVEKKVQALLGIG